MQPDWRERFFLDLVERLNQRGVRCAITGGLACIELGVLIPAVGPDLDYEGVR